MSTLVEVLARSPCVRRARAPLPLLRGLPQHPSDPIDANLRAIATLEAATGAPTGWSDHTVGDESALAAAALGAAVIEKHLALDRSLPGPDHAASMEPADFGRFVSRVRL